MPIWEDWESLSAVRVMNPGLSLPSAWLFPMRKCERASGRALRTARGTWQWHLPMLSSRSSTQTEEVSRAHFAVKFDRRKWRYGENLNLGTNACPDDAQNRVGPSITAKGLIHFVHAFFWLARCSICALIV